MLSIIIPFYNEAENLPTLIKRLIEVGKENSLELEIVLVDDGSTDDSVSSIKYQVSSIKNLKLISNKKRRGKGEALNTGVKNAKGDVFAFMDADLQDDPEDLPKFLRKLDEGFDFVNGIRMGRHKDNFILEAYSNFAGKFLRTFLHSPYTDINCGFKVFNRKVLNDFVFYGNNFRFFPLAVFYNRYMVTEIEVKNNQRLYGKSKFGPTKLVTGIFDTLTAYFIYRFAEKPLHFFGSVGIVLFLIGFIISLVLAIERLFFGVLLYQRPILWLGISLIIVGIQVIMTGVIGELIVYIHKKKDK